MLEPTIIRQTATLADWQYTHGMALGDDGSNYPLDVNYFTEVFASNPPLKVGDKLELYLHLNEKGEVEKIEFCRPPKQGDAQYLNYVGNSKEVFKINGLKIFSQPRHYIAVRAIGILILAALWLFIYFTKGKVEIFWLIYSATYCIANIIAIWRIYKNPHSFELWRLTLNQQGVAFGQQNDGKNGFYHWQQIESYAFCKSKFLRRKVLRLYLKSGQKMNVSMASVAQADFDRAHQFLQTHLPTRVQAA
ncbi:hypothetical protein ACKLNO_01280 [Neisseriaceae bacterium B1]